MPGRVSDAALLAGGQGSRLGNGSSGKLETDLGGKALGLRAYLRLKDAFGEPIVVTQDGEAPPSLEGCRAIMDSPVGRGPAAGIAAALRTAQDWCFVAAADMPFLDKGLIKELIAMVEALPGDCVCAMPSWRKGLEPLHAFYRKGALGRIEEFLAAGKRSLTELSLFLGAAVLDAEAASGRCGADPETAFFNVNTGEDLDTARVILYKLGDIKTEKGDLS